ncbi:MAG TPA: recombinase family protein [Anaerolineales bacterium]|nr:recombinase family protein [Anaerolineales bacterium]
MIRFGILAGVSSDAQVEDKESIPDQIRTCRHAIAQLAGVEIACYTMDGYSRTGYDSLADAMNDIPPLKEAIEAAQRDQYDVLILDNWDRLGDLGQLVHTRFKKYRKQIYSARQSGRLQDPESYDPYSDESAGIDMHIQGILQKYRVNKLRRGWQIGMPKRVEKGLTPLRVPFGYTWVSPKEPPELDPTRAALIIQMKDLLLSGRSMQAIARHADRSGIAPPNGGARWDIGTVRYILANPYYAGLVTIHRTVSVHDPSRKRKRRPIKQPRAKWVMGQGKHECIWDQTTHRALVHELERRRESHKNYAVRFPLSGLLRCAVCRKKLYRRSHGHASAPNGRWKVLTCAQGPSHLILPYEESIDFIARQLAAQLATYQAEPAEARRDEAQKHDRAALDELAKRRKRIQDGFEGGLYSQAEAAEKLAEVTRQVENIEHQVEEHQRRADLRAEFLGPMQDHLDDFPAWIKTDDPAIVNRLLGALCETILIYPDRSVEIIWRT